MSGTFDASDMTSSRSGSDPQGEYSMQSTVATTLDRLLDSLDPKEGKPIDLLKLLEDYRTGVDNIHEALMNETGSPVENETPSSIDSLSNTLKTWVFALAGAPYTKQALGHAASGTNPRQRTDNPADHDGLFKAAEGGIQLTSNHATNSLNLQLAVNLRHSTVSLRRAFQDNPEITDHKQTQLEILFDSTLKSTIQTGLRTETVSEEQLHDQGARLSKFMRRLASVLAVEGTVIDSEGEIDMAASMALRERVASRKGK